MTETTKHLHFISHSHNREMITSTFECRGDETAPCHQYPDCGCEIAGCGHPSTPHAECMVKPWMDDACAQECFDLREPTPVRDGPITAWFDGDCYAWDYAEPEGMNL